MDEGALGEDPLSIPRTILIRQIPSQIVLYHHMSAGVGLVAGSSCPEEICTSRGIRTKKHLKRDPESRWAK